MTLETEVLGNAAPRRFTAAEGLRVLTEANRCANPGELGAPLASDEKP